MPDNGIVLRPGSSVFVGSAEAWLDNGTKVTHWTRIKDTALCVLEELNRGEVSVSSLCDTLGMGQASLLLGELEEAGMIREAYENLYAGTVHERLVDYYAQFTDSPNDIIPLIQSKNVLVLGLGGIGCVTIQHLIEAGVRRFILVDDDEVNASNLNRQCCYVPSDIGRSKTAAMETYILERAVDAEIHIHNKAVTSRLELEQIHEQHPEIDLLACCTDNTIAMVDTVVAQFCLRHSIPCSFSGVHLDYGFWGPTLDKEEYIARFLTFMNQAQESGHRAHPLRASMGCTNAVIASLFAKDLTMLLGNMEPVLSRNRMLRFDFQTCNTTELATFWQ